MGRRESTCQTPAPLHGASITNWLAVITHAVLHPQNHRALQTRVTFPSWPGNKMGFPSARPGPRASGKDSLLHVVLPRVDLLEPGQLQPPVGRVAREARPQALEPWLGSFRPRKDGFQCTF